jgi:hypothetical protein
MDNERNPGEPEKKHIGSDLIIPAAALVFTIYYFTTIWNSPWTAQVSAFFIGTVLICLIAAFVGFTVLSLVRGEADLGFQRISEPLSLIPRRVILLALTVGFILLIPWGGFTLTTFLFLSSAMLLLSRGARWKFILVLSAVLAIGGYFLFEYAFEVRFPKGPFEMMMDPMMSEAEPTIKEFEIFLAGKL